ncbi:hypothetical protein HK405_011652 [Cladochytrium tenue]|nr:hypothetical protein HK405_011652 [Cladochytrium tenue]
MADDSAGNTDAAAVPPAVDTAAVVAVAAPPRRKRKWDVTPDDFAPPPPLSATTAADVVPPPALDSSDDAGRDSDAAPRLIRPRLAVHGLPPKPPSGPPLTLLPPPSLLASSIEGAAAPGVAAAVDPKNLAELAASRINAMLQTQKVVGSSSSLLSSASSSADSTNAVELPGVKPLPVAATQKLIEYTKDIEINDFKNRFLLTKGATQSDIKKSTGADVVTRGKYYSDKSVATEKDPPLYLHISAVSQEILDAAVAKIEDIMKQPPPSLLSTKVFLGFEPERSFNVRAKIVGPQGQYVKHIQQATGTRVILRGQGSGYDGVGAAEAEDEQLHILVSGQNEDGIDKAKGLCEDLIKTVKDMYEQFKNRSMAPLPMHPPPPPPPPPAMGPPIVMNPYLQGGFGIPQQHQQQHHHPLPPPPMPPPPPPPPPPTPVTQPPGPFGGPSSGAPAAYPGYPGMPGVLAYGGPEGAAPSASVAYGYGGAPYGAGGYDGYGDAYAQYYAAAAAAAAAQQWGYGGTAPPQFQQPDGNSGGGGGK